MIRYLLIFVSVSFIWELGLAQTTSSGTISIIVPKHLQINIVDPNIQFTYNEANPNGWPPTNGLDFSMVKIDANVNWKLAICPLNGETVLTNPNTTMTILASQFEYRLEEITGTVSSGGGVFHKFNPLSLIPITGSKNADFKLYWRPNPAISGNLFAGDYTIGISYSLVEQ